MTSKSAHLDSFAADNLPPRELWPRMDYSVLPELNYPDRLNCAVEILDGAIRAGFSNKTAIFFRDQEWSYAELLERSNKLAHVLTGLPGFVPGKRVLLRGPNTPLMAAAWFAVLKAGGICVTTMPLLRQQELSYMVEKARIEFALCDAAWRSELDSAAVESGCLKTILYFDNSEGGQVEKMMAAQPAAFDSVATSADDVALLAFTSGSTGRAKTTMHFHRDVMAICDLFPSYVLKAQSSDVFCGSPPLAFTFGLGGLLLFPLRVGASTVFVEKPQPEEILRVIQERRVSVLFTSPTAYKAMLPHLSTFDIATLKKCVAAGETLPLSTFKAWERATGVKIVDGIGATEMLHIFISASGDEIRPGATGKAVSGYEARVVSESGQSVPDGEVGLLAVRGPTGCRYLGDVERQKEYVRDGWNFTGDAYVRDKDGYFWFHSRADDMIISSGYNISGVEVENVLLSHPAVKECGVVGVPDAERGTIVKACVVLRDQGTASPEMARELQDYVKAQIAPYKYPRAIEFMAALPRTETGKLQRFRLRD